MFACYNCINSSLVCDGVLDCKDGKDEKNCNKAMTPPQRTFNLPFPSNGTVCPKGTFTCKSQICIPESWKCDGTEDCADGEDELNCAKKYCFNNEFSCGPPNYSCITSSWVCDGELDCNDGKDEQNCNGTMMPPPRTVNSILPYNGTVCGKGLFTCKNQNCIPETWSCDDSDDCGDNSDEIGCPHNSTLTPSQSTIVLPPLSCQDNEFKCLSNFCIPRSRVCDRKDDCLGGEDELNCANNVCLHYEFSCGPPNYNCINSSWICDGVSDCKDGKDEKNCNGTVTPPPRTVNSTLPNNGTVCPKGTFTCKNQICIPERWKCDGNEDCAGGEDELNCASKACLNNEFSCGPPIYNCITSSWVCDGEPDCNDGKDEKNCNGTMTPPPRTVNSTLPYNGTFCRIGLFTCKNQKCVPETWKCDDNDDCGDNSDEIGCDNSTVTPSQSTIFLPPFSCQSNEFKCLSDVCIPRSRVCDTQDDCVGGEDELNCANHVCLDYEFSCGSPNYNCINSSWVCDGQSDCSDGKDEQNCNGTIMTPVVVSDL